MDLEQLIFHFLLLCAPILSLGAVAGCVNTDSDPPESSGGMSNTGGDTATGAAVETGGTGDGPAEGGTGAAPEPAPGAVYRCEDPSAPKVTAAGDSPVIVDFETGALGPPSDTGEASGDFMFTGGESGGTYTYQESGTQIMRTVGIVDDRNGGQALSVMFTNATDYGGGMGVYFYPCLDASVYTGITFWARGALPERAMAGAAIAAGTVTISLDVGDVATNSRDSIGCAGEVPVDATLCTRPATTFVVSDTWTQFTFSWSDFAPGNKNGTPYIPNGDNLLGVNLTMDNAFATSNDLELVIDDVAFVP